MSVLLTVVLAVQMLSALVMIGLILVQHGKGADMGAAFGSGGSGSLFGASGSANFLSRTTGILAAVFFASTLLLAYYGNAQPRTSSSVLEGAAVTAPVPGAAASDASGASQIPGTTAPSTSGAVVPVAPAPAASGAAQIPTK
ncbi:MAG: preprotein translocase subunit SecG [Polaromonas sp.]